MKNIIINSFLSHHLVSAVDFRLWLYRHWKSFGLILIVTLLQPWQAHSVEWVFEKGKQFELCQKMEKNLKLYPKLTRWMCNLPIDPQFKDFSKIEWEELDPFEYWDVIREITINRTDLTNKYTPEQQQFGWLWARPYIQIFMREGHASLGRARFDLNFDGKPDTVYRWGIVQCENSHLLPEQAFRWNYFVLSRDNSVLSEQMRRYARRPYDAFLFQGRTFLGSGDYGLQIFEPNSTRQGKGLAMVEVCRFVDKVKRRN